MGRRHILGSHSYTSMASNDLSLTVMQTTEIHPTKPKLNPSNSNCCNRHRKALGHSSATNDTERSLTEQTRGWSVTMVALLPFKPPALQTLQICGSICIYCEGSSPESWRELEFDRPKVKALLAYGWISLWWIITITLPTFPEWIRKMLNKL